MPVTTSYVIAGPTAIPVNNAISFTAPQPIKVMCVGDSETTGAQFGGYRTWFWEALRQQRGDIRMLGTPLGGGDSGRYVLGEWFQRGVGGITIQTMQANIAGYLATDGNPDCMLLLIGSNNILTETPAQTQAAWNSLMLTLLGLLPACRIICISIPPRNDAGPGVLANGQAFNAFLPGGVAALNNVNVSFADGCAGMTPADVNPDALHLNEVGSHKLGRALALSFNTIFPIVQNGRTYPRIFCRRTAGLVARFNNAGADFVAATAAAQMPSTGVSFAYSWYMCPDAIVSTSQTIFATTGANSGFAMSMMGQTLSFVFDGVEGGWSMPAAPFYQAGQWVRFVVSYHNADGYMAFWANGMLLAVFGISPVPPFTNPALVWGFSASKGAGFVGEISDIQGTFGANVPTFANMRDLVETNFFENERLPLCSFNFLLAGALVDATGGTSASSSSNTYVTTGLAAPAQPTDPTATQALVPLPSANLVLCLEGDYGVTGVMGAVVATGTGTQAVTLTGTPVGAPLVEIDLLTAGALGVAKAQLKVNGSFQFVFQLAATVPLGFGLTANFPAATYNADNVYTSTPTVGTWADQSGLGANAVQATQSHQPTYNPTGGPNGAPYLSNPQATGGGGLGTMTGTFAQSLTACTVFVVASYVSTGNGEVPFATNDINTGTALFYQNPGMSVRANETTLITTQNSEPALDAAFHTHAYVIDSSFITYYRDGLQRTRIPSNGLPVAQTVYNLFMFGTNTSFPWKGGIAAVAVYNTALASIAPQMSHYQSKFGTPAAAPMPLLPQAIRFQFSANASLTTGVAQNIPPGNAATTSSSDLVIGEIATAPGILSSLAAQFTGSGSNVGGQTATFQVLLNGAPITGAASAALATTAGNKTSQVQFPPVPYVPGGIITIQITPSAGLTAALTDVMASVS
jgi:hypothetical protein